MQMTTKPSCHHGIPRLLHSLNKFTLLWASGRSINAEKGRDACGTGLGLLDGSQELLRRLGVVGRIIIEGLSNRRNAWGWRSIDSDAALPGLFQSIWRLSISILSSNDTPERSSACVVDLAKTLFVNYGDVYGSADDIAVETERWVGGRVRESTT